MFKAAIVLMQFMISAQAGLVNFVEGPASVQLRQQVPAGMPIETGPQGHAEILLDRWSEGRSSELARANAMTYRERSTGSLYSYAGFPYWALFPGRANWLYSPLLNGFTLIPQSNYRSYWGYRFAPVFVFGASSFSRSTISRPPSVSRGPSRTIGSRAHPHASIGRSRGSFGGRRGGFGGMHGR